jgi:hypothetical protein
MFASLIGRLGSSGLIGSVRRECTDHVIVFNEEHLRRIPKYAGCTLHTPDRAVRRLHCAADPWRDYTIDMHESDFSEATPQLPTLRAGSGP